MKSMALVVVVAVVALVTSTGAGSAQAVPVRIFGGEIDGYRLIVTALPQEPVIGTIHFMVVPTNVTTSDPIQSPLRIHCRTAFGEDSL